jgi:acetyl-CoA synthetase
LLYGPLANGVTTLLFEGVPTYPDPGRFWQIVDQYQVSIFYTAPTVIRILAGAGDPFVKKYHRSSLRTLGSVGEPIHPEAWNWYHNCVGDGRCSIVDTWWQTETGGILISPLAGISPMKPGSASFPLPGIEPRLVDDSGKVLEGSTSGSLVMARSWPGQMIGVYGTRNRFREIYFSQIKNAYFTGDGARRDEEGFYWISGRIDDVIKVSGHRLGTSEIEAACMTHPAVAEAAAVGVPDEITGEALHIFVVLKGDILTLKEHPEQTQEELQKQLQKEIFQTIRSEVGPVVHPQKLYWSPGLPKTRSGKIMRRFLRKIAMKDYDHMGDITTLADPTILSQAIEGCNRNLN